LRLGTPVAGILPANSKLLAHSIHRVLKFFQLALEIHIFQLMTIHMGFKQLCREHLGSAAMADRRAKRMLVMLDVVIFLTYR
jgi:hypothetical protein